MSEPALRPDAGGYLLAYRAWNEPTPPRGLLTSNLEGEFQNQIGDFWEDAQPDWSPTKNRLVFASQRESDRRWRLYTSWGDGTAEKELRREGKSPSFAPDGYMSEKNSARQTVTLSLSLRNSFEEKRGYTAFVWYSRSLPRLSSPDGIESQRRRYE